MGKETTVLQARCLTLPPHSPPPLNSDLYNHLFILQLSAHSMLNTYKNHQLPPTCFRVPYTIFGKTIVLLAQKL
jgi:hypothetical protein